MGNRTCQWVLLTLAATLSASCTKEAAYDDLTKSDGIDLSVSISSRGLTIPLGSLDKVYLSELIKAEESKNIHVDDDSVFYIYKEGSLRESKVSVDAVDFNYDPNIDPRVFRLNMKNEIPQNMLGLLNMKQPGQTLDELDRFPNINLTCKNIYLNDRAKLSNYTISANDVDRGLIEVNKALFKEEITTQFKIEITNLPSPESEYDVVLHDILINLPPYLLARNEKNVEYKNGLIDCLGDNGSRDVHLIKKAGESTIHWESDKIYMRGGEFADVPLTNNDGEIFRSDTIIMSSEIEIPEVTMAGKDLVVALDDNGQKTVEYKEQVVVRTTMDNLKGTLTHIEGRFDPDIAPISRDMNIDICSELDFMKNQEDIILDTKNPNIELTIFNTCDIKLFADVTLDTHNGTPIVYHDVLITPSADDDKIHIKLTATESDPANNVYASPALSTFIQPIPDKVSVSIDAHTDRETTYPFHLGEDIKVGADYKINIPFNFNHVKFVYDRVAEDVFKEEITDYVNEVEEATVQFTAISTLPIDTKIEVCGRDKEGIERESLIQSSTVTIPKGSIESPTSIPVEITVSVPDITQVKDLVIRMTGEGSDCEFKSTQYLKFDDAKVKINKINLDLNDK